MEIWFTQVLNTLLTLLAIPQFGLGAVFIVSFLSATLLPMGSEPAVFGLVKLSPDLFWPAVLVATVGNTCGGLVTYWMGYGAQRIIAHQEHPRLWRWLERLGPKALILSWLPVVGDPLCAVAGWLKMPFLSCAVFMLIGKFLRYVLMTTVLLYIFPTA